MLKGKLTSEVISERQQCINSLKRYVFDKKEQLQQVFDQLQLTKELLAKVEAKQICPFNKNHSVPEHAFKKHVEHCRLLHAGYQRDELSSQLQNLDVCYEGTDIMRVNIDESLLNKIIWDECAQSGQVYTGHRTMPISYIDEAVNLTESDRLAVYNHVVKVSNDAGKVIPVDHTDQLLTTDWGQLVKKGMLNEQSNQQYSSKLEQLAALRDMKRRRQSYRAKNVHVTKKSYTEIIREVIVNQMEILVPEKESSKGSVPEEVKSSSRDRKRRHRDSDDRRAKDSYGYSRRRRSRERSMEGKYDHKVKQHKEQTDYGKRYKISGDVETTHLSDSSNSTLERFEKNTPDIKKDLDWNDPSQSQGHDSSDVGQRERHLDKLSLQTRESDSSASSNDEDDHRNRRNKHKKSKHKKKHSKKHKRKDRPEEA